MPLSKTRIICLIMVLILFAVGFISLYEVKEGERALIFQWGSKAVDLKSGKAKIALPGLHFKMPILEQVYIFDTRLHALTIKSLSITTEDKKNITVDIFLSWKISDFPRYYESFGENKSDVPVLVEQQFKGNWTAGLGRFTWNEILTNPQGNVTNELRQRTAKALSEEGIELVDIHAQDAEHSPETMTSIYNDMQTQFKQEAQQRRLEAKATTDAIRSDADTQVELLLAKARMKAEKIRSEGDAEAANIYVEVYSKNLSFYRFYRRLLAYKTIFANRQDVWIDGELFKHLESAGR